MAKKTKRSHSTATTPTPPTPHSSTSTSTSSDKGDHLHVKHSPSSSEKKKKKGFFGLLKRTLTMCITLTLIVVMWTIALANVNFLIRGSHPTVSWARAQLERGLSEPLIDHTLQLTLADLVHRASPVLPGALQDLISPMSWLKGRETHSAIHDVGLSSNMHAASVW